MPARTSRLVCPLKTPEKLMDKRRLFPQTLLFSGFDDCPGLDPRQDFSVPVKELAKLWSDVRSFLVGHLPSMPVLASADDPGDTLTRGPARAATRAARGVATFVSNATRAQGVNRATPASPRVEPTAA
jgi:hypothetical protein